MTTESRRIRLTGARNLRDLGGYPVAGGGRVRRGLVYRSDDLSELVRGDLARLARLNLRTVIDFRGVGEALSCPDRLPPSVRRRESLPIEAGRVIGGLYDGRLTLEKAMGVMASVYRALVSDFQETYRRFFAVMAEADASPLLFHCTAGKDRTGLAAALFLSVLGVDRRTVVEEYLFSRECLREKYVAGVDYDSDSEPLYSVFPEFIQAAFDLVDGEYGGAEAFAEERLGADRRRLAELYVEPAR